ncbi:hypothetical protein L596_008468 [Steinernema carpocapsae]|uniref:Multidrug resistance-associated protein 1 n=1 Tax=Steinernema carpocapsae TaxID=34508 RepID=A0A4U5PD35_STECR|nr:hypothetical protein L596_008468 [Steinernema carpocapsae]
MLGLGICPVDFEPNPYTNGSWAIPDATECLQQSDLRLIPGIFLLLTAPILIYRSLHGVENRGSKHQLNKLIYVKTAISFLLLLNGIVLAVSDATLKIVPILLPIAFVISLFLASGMHFLSQKKGIFTSGVLFGYSVILAICSIPEFRFRLERFIHNGAEDGIRFNITAIFFPLALLQAILSCFSNFRWSTLTNPEKSPELMSSFLNQQLYSWVTGLIVKGYKSPLVHDDVYLINDKDSCQNVVKEYLHYWKKNKRSSRSPSGTDTEQLIEEDSESKEFSILWPLICAHKWEIFTLLAVCIGDLVNYLIPFFLGQLIDFTGDLTKPAWSGFGWALCLLFATEALSLITRAFYYRMHILEMNISSTFISMVYTKALRLSNEARKRRTVGEIVNLMSVDVDNFKEFFESLINIFYTPIAITVGAFMLYQVIGVAAFAGIAACALLIAPSSLFVTRLRERAEDERMEVRDERVKMTNEVLNGIKAVKMYAWEDSVKLIVEKLRSKELGLLAKMMYLTAFLHSCYGCIHFVVTGTALGAYIFIDPEHNVLTPKVAFVTLTLLDVIYNPLFELPFIFSGMIRFMVSNRRLRSFLNEKELEVYIENTPTPEGVISVQNASFYWEKGGRMVLRDISMAVKQGELVAVVGEVGCGKSSLMAALLGEMTKESGSVNVAGSVAYVPQQAWIQNGTLKNNVLFGTPLDEHHYEEVIDACALRPDLEMLAAGDATEIGERGINLSGGQKQRVSLARAVYSQRDVFFLDDPLSAVDAHVGKHLFEKVFSSETGILKDKTRILVTHGVHFLKFCDRVIVLKDGQISEQGTYEELLHAGGAFAEFLEEFVGKALERRRTFTDESMEEVEEELNEVLTDLGSFSPEVRKRFETQISQVSRASGDFKDIVAPEAKRSKNEDENDGQLIEEESLLTGQVSMSVYTSYFRAMTFKFGIPYFVTFAICGFFRYQNQLWLANWSDRTSKAENGSHTESMKEDLFIYVGFAAGEAISYSVQEILYTAGVLKASQSIHSALLNNVLRLPMSFFDTTPLGRILNRFGKDIEGADDNLPDYWAETGYALFETLIALVIVVRGSFYSVPMIILILVLNKVIVSYYIRSSRQLRRLESITKSPIYSHFQESLQGAMSIRAYGSCERFLLESNKRTDINKAAFYYNSILNQWLVIRLEFLGSLLTFCAALVAVFFREDAAVSAGIIGLAVSQSLHISRQLAWTMRMISGMENNIVSVERISEYTHLPTEAPAESEEGRRPPQEWPEQGAIEMRNLAIRYREGLDLVLRGISVNIQPGEKIGIVGRTGAGKSSLTLALFRIVEADSGKILIDGRDISTVGLTELRANLTIVPQDPVLFSGSLRMNLDPFGEFADARLWEALEVASLKPFVEALPERLEHEVAEGGENLSVGQRQLVCLARAALRRTRVLVLDEAAAALDLETDALIQRTLREHFRSCTVLTIAHRLHSVLDSDRVLVLDRGQIREFDAPQKLLADPNSQFYSMAREAGIV